MVWGEPEICQSPQCRALRSRLFGSDLLSAGLRRSLLSVAFVTPASAPPAILHSNNCKCSLTGEGVANSDAFRDTCNTWVRSQAAVPADCGHAGMWPCDARSYFFLFLFSPFIPPFISLLRKAKNLSLFMCEVWQLLNVAKNSSLSYSVKKKWVI